MYCVLVVRHGVAHRVDVVVSYIAKRKSIKAKQQRHPGVSYDELYDMKIFPVF